MALLRGLAVCTLAASAAAAPIDREATTADAAAFQEPAHSVRCESVVA